MKTLLTKSFAFILIFLLVFIPSAVAGSTPPSVEELNYEETKLNADDFATEDYFGWSIDASGDRAVVGAPFEDGTGISKQGAAYIFVRSGAGWVQEQKILAPDASEGDEFGNSVAISGDTVLVGAYTDDVGGNVNQGSAYIFWYDGGTWILQDLLIADDGVAGDMFGISVALDGDTALVGAYHHDGDYNLQGAAYAFTRSGYTWSQQQELRATDGGVADYFGSSVALDGDNALVGAPNDDDGADLDVGSAYFFTRTGSVWSQQDKLTADDGSEGDLFGYSVDLDGLTALIGAPQDTYFWYRQGSAYLFRKLIDWYQEEFFVDSWSEAYEGFGNSVALSGDTALVTASGADVGGNLNQGYAALFYRVGSDWNLNWRTLAASDGVPESYYGVDCALMGDIAWVTAPYVNIGETVDAGAVYVYEPIYKLFVPLIVRAAP